MRSVVSINSFIQYSRFRNTTNIGQKEISGVSNTSTTTENAQQTSVLSKETTTPVAAAASSRCVRPRHTKLLQGFFLIWLDPKIDENKKDFQDSITEFRNIVLTVELFTDVDECVAYTRSMKKDTIILIISGTLGENIIPDIHDMTQIHTILVFCRNIVRHKEWITKWPKVQYVSASIKDVCESLKEVVRQRDHDAVSMSFVPKQTTRTMTALECKNLDQLDSSHMYSILFKDIVLQINEDDTKQIEKFMDYCRDKAVTDTQLSKFYNDYQNHTAVWLYTKGSFLYSTLNNALRTFDTETMLRMGFFIRKLHQQLERLYREQSHIFEDEFTVYRGQRLSQEGFQHLCDTKNGLLSFNSFLSTSTNKDVALMFASNEYNSRNNNIYVLFIITIDPVKASSSGIPFAFIENYSAFQQEEEVLFSMHAVFRIQNIYEPTENNGICEVKLTLTDDNDPQLADLIPHMRFDFPNLSGWFRMSYLMIRIGHFDQAEMLFQELLKDASSDDERTELNQGMGTTNFFQGQYKEAVKYCEEGLKLKLKTVTESDPSMAPSYSNIGGVYRKLGDHSKALEFYKKIARYCR